MDEIKSEPVIQGIAGKAWRCPNEKAVIAHYVVEAKWAHPFWHSYSFVLVHLRPIEGLDTLFYLDGATHEFWIYALNPEKPRNDIVSGTANSAVGGYWLTPNNFAAQLIAESDEAALMPIKAAIVDVCNGTLSPDTDFMSMWIARFGDNMVKERHRANALN